MLIRCLPPGNEEVSSAVAIGGRATAEGPAGRAGRLAWADGRGAGGRAKLRISPEQSFATADQTISS